MLSIVTGHGPALFTHFIHSILVKIGAMKTITVVPTKLPTGAAEVSLVLVSGIDTVRANCRVWILVSREQPRSAVGSGSISHDPSLAPRIKNWCVG